MRFNRNIISQRYHQLNVNFFTTHTTVNSIRRWWKFDKFQSPIFPVTSKTQFFRETTSMSKKELATRMKQTKQKCSSILATKFFPIIYCSWQQRDPSEYLTITDMNMQMLFCIFSINLSYFCMFKSKRFSLKQTCWVNSSRKSKS